MSSSGETIELTVSYDHDLSQMYFDDFLNGLDGNNCERIKLDHNNDIFLLGDSCKPNFKKSHLSKMSKSNLFEMATDYELLSSYCEAHYTKIQLMDELVDITIKQHYEHLASRYNWHEIKHHVKHDHYVSRGYSQGDVVLVVSIDEPVNRGYIDSLFWDCPIHIYLSVNDNDELGYELLNDYYEYDQNKVAENVKKLDISEYAKTRIIDNLPREPESR